MFGGAHAGDACRPCRYPFAVQRFHELSTATAQHLADVGLEIDETLAIVDLALSEDLTGSIIQRGLGTDVTSVATIPSDQRSLVRFVARADGVVAAVPVAAAVIERVCGAGQVAIEVTIADGEVISPGRHLMSVEAPTSLMLTAERTALNLICHLSGVASATRRFVEAARGTRAQIRDTRKTMPGLRALEKYAVRCGGGVNHRMGLYDAALIKDNHVAAAGGITAAYELVVAASAGLPVEVEVDSLEQLREALSLGVAEVLVDNFRVEELLEAVELRDAIAPSVKLEASGGITLATAAAVARSGVDYLAVGELTHSAPVLDIGLDFIEIR